MAVLEKIRVKLGVLITVLIGVALLSFIVDVNTFQSAISLFSSRYDVGKMGRKSITYQDYQKEIDYFTSIYQLSAGGRSMDEQTHDAINNNAWQKMINDNIIMPTIKKVGISVGDDEMFDLTQGREISPILTQDPTFADENGNFNRANLINFLQAMSQDLSGSVSAYWGFIEDNIYNQQMTNKYISLFRASNYINPVEFKRGIQENNITSSVDFVVKPFGFQLDSAIVVTNGEIQNYYKKNQDKFRQVTSRDIDFVVYEVVPSAEDYASARNEMDRLYDEFSASTNLRNFLARNSDRPLANFYLSEAEMDQYDERLGEYAFRTKNPQTLRPFLKSEEDIFISARIYDTKMMSDSAFVQHILLPATEKAKADSLLKVVSRSKLFSQLALEYSQDQNPNVLEPGDIGWLTQNQMIPGMDTVLSVVANKPFILNTAYGIHIVNVKEKTKPQTKKRLALMAKEVITSRATFQDYYAKANDLAARSEGKIENFNRIVSEENLPVYPAVNIVEGARQISRYSNMREASRWIYEAKVGEVSPIITVDNKYFFVIAVTEAREEGIIPLNKIQSQITAVLSQEKRAEKMTNDIKAQIASLSTLEEIADKLETTISRQSSIAFGSMNTQALDPALIGAVSGAEIEKISGPISGNIGVFVFNVTGREEGAYYTEDDEKIRREQVTGYQIQQVQYTLLEMAGVKDWRGRFF